MNSVTVYTHKLFGSFRVVKRDNNEVLFITSDIANCLRYKNIKRVLKKRNIQEVEVYIDCISAVNNRNIVLDKKKMKALTIEDVMFLIRISDRVDCKILDMWIKREVLKDDDFWIRGISFNREYFKDEYIKMQSAELDLLKAKIYLLEAKILEKVSDVEYESIISQDDYDSGTTNSVAKINKFKSFYNELYGEVRVIYKTNELYFVGNDIAEILKYSRPNEAVKLYCPNLKKATIYTEIKLNYNDRDMFGKRMVNIIPFKDVQNLINMSSKIDKRMFELWIRQEILKEENGFEKDVVYQGEYYKDEFIKVLSKEIDMYREQIKLLEEEMYLISGKVIQENKDLVTNYSLKNN